MPSVSRRDFFQGAAAITATAIASQPTSLFAALPHSPFRIAVINDEISQDFDHACYVASHDFGMKWIELRGMWGKNILDLGDDDVERARKILAKHQLSVTDIASPLFKTDWPGAPISKFSSSGDKFGATDTNFKEQDRLLEQSIELTKKFNTGKVRCFDFWRLEDQKPYREAIDAKLHEAAETTGKHGVLLVLENEHECNTGTGREAARTLAAVPSPHFGLNWDPGNAVMRGELDAWPNGWNALPKHRVHHCHVKNTARNAAGKLVWSPVDKGYIDWTAQFRALKEIGYHDAVSLETHWRGAGTPEASSRISWAGMKQCLEKSGALG
jgi:sugar phosphate isomerase/epimerase